jgi:superfamily II DNA or RNA helicase
MEKIIVAKKNDVYLYISCERGTAQELSSYFSFFVPNYRFHPSFKNRMWDGKIRLFNLNTSELYVGLLHYLKLFCKKYEYTLELEHGLEETNKIEFNEISDYVIKNLQPRVKGKPITPRDYQLYAIHHAINNNRVLLLSPTSSGKSLIIYSIIRWYENNIISDNEKIMIIVPTTNLVEQMSSDFLDYSSHDATWNGEDKIHKIYSGKEKNTDKKITISTWQSLYKLPESTFKDYRIIVGDECHLFKAKSLTTLLTKFKNCPYRFGTTGTLDGTQTNKLVLEGLFGKINTVTTSKELMEKNHISSLSIKCLVLQYNDHTRKLVKKVKYQDEINFLVESKIRNNFIKNLLLSLEGNSLLLFNYVQKHGKVLYELIKKSKHAKDKNIYFVSGATKVEQREEVRTLTEKNDNAIILASSGVLSTGTNIKNLQNLIFAHPSKGKIRNLQSIGRILRLDDKNNKATLYDIADDMSSGKYENFSLKHFLVRLNLYNQQQFDYKTYKIEVEENEKMS